MKSLLENDINETFQKYISKSKEMGMTDEEIEKAIKEGIQKLRII